MHQFDQDLVIEPGDSLSYFDRVQAKITPERKGKSQGMEA
jgi:hypothetical protein